MIISQEESATIGSGVTALGCNVFFYCTSLKSITIPKTVTSLGAFVFFGCDSLTDVYYTGSEAEWNKLDIDFSNEELKSATVHFNDASSDPGDEGNKFINNPNYIESTSAEVNQRFYDNESFIVY